MHGALLAALAAGARGAPPIMHARSLNPYVAAAIADWRRTRGLIAIVPRVPAALAACIMVVSAGSSVAPPGGALAMKSVQRSDKMKCFWAELLLSGRVVLEKGV